MCNARDLPAISQTPVFDGVPDKTLTHYHISTFDFVVTGDVLVRLPSVDGKVIRESQRKNFNGTYREEMDLRNAPKGVYLLGVNGSEGRMLKKIVLE